MAFLGCPYLEHESVGILHILLTSPLKEKWTEKCSVKAGKDT